MDIEWWTRRCLRNIIKWRTLFILSSQKIVRYTPKDIYMRINDNITLADWELTEQFTRASGPGGQHVNKVSTAVELRFEAGRSVNLSEPIKRRLKKLAGRRWTQDGAIIIFVQDTRSQARNREIARNRLAELIRKAVETPKRRVSTKPTYGSIKRRLKVKKVRGEVKKLRGKIEE